MIFEAVIASVGVALVSLVGVVFFGNTKQLQGIQRYLVPVAVGIFLSLVLFELIPETLLFAPEYGGLVVAIGFIGFYIFARFLHHHFHQAGEKDCDKKSAATLLLFGDAVHNIADGVILGGAFLVDPAVGVATAIGLAIHEVPQEIIEFGVLIRAGYSRTKAALLNLFSASSIVLGTLLILVVAEHAEEYAWIITGLAAGNLLYLAASDLLPRVHDGVEEYGGIWRSTLAIIIGFIVMTIVVSWVHGEFGHGHSHEYSEHHDDDGHGYEDEHLEDEAFHEEIERLGKTEPAKPL